MVLSTIILMGVAEGLQIPVGTLVHWSAEILTRALLRLASQVRQTVADEQVRQRVGQAEQMAVPEW